MTKHNISTEGDVTFINLLELLLFTKINKEIIFSLLSCQYFDM